jgi:hypothetical protein
MDRDLMDLLICDRSGSMDLDLMDLDLMNLDLSIYGSVMDLDLWTWI